MRFIRSLFLAIVLACLPTVSWGAIALVQGHGTTVVDTNTTATMVWPSDTTTGNAIVCVIGWSSPPEWTLASVTDSQTNTYTLSTFTRSGGAGVVDVTIAHAQNITGGTTPTITGTWSDIGANPLFGKDITCGEFSGLALSGMLDQAAGQSQTDPGTGANAVTSGNVSTNKADELIVSGSCCFTEVPGDPTVPGTGFAYIDPSPVTGVQGEYKIVSGIGTYAGTWTTTSATDDFGTRVATFRAIGTCVSGLTMMGMGGC